MGALGGLDLGALAREAEIAAALARDAGAACLTVRAEGFRTDRKDDDSPVTRADLASERIVRDGLAAALPADGLLSEETDGLDRGASGRTWVVDPLDGTRGFVAGTSGWSIQIALLDGETPVLGVVFEPHDDRLYVAARGRGAWLLEAGAAPARVSVSAVDDPAAMRLVTSTSMPVEAREHLLERTGYRDVGRINSVGTKVGYLVRGVADVYVSEHPCKYWDSAAPLVLCEEAGGVMTLASGAAFAYDLSRPHARHPGPFVATNGVRHDAVLATVRAAMGW